MISLFAIDISTYQCYYYRNRNTDMLYKRVVMCVSELLRFGVSINSDLLKKFDKLIDSKGYNNRSEAIRDMIREHLVEQEWEEDAETIGAVTIVYDHHVRELSESLISLQHGHHSAVISSMHVHIDHHNCLEIIVIRGRGSNVKEIAGKLISTKGVKHGKLTMTTTGKELE
jgi:CopG family nickel-responsive transcriptional regulator